MQHGSALQGGLPVSYSYLSFCICTKTGRFRSVEGSIRRVCHRGVWLWSLLLVDVYARFLAVERDALTNLMGRHLFFSKVSEREEADRAEGVYGRDALAYFNLTNFKQYNATYGAEGGDDFLRKIAAVLRHTFPDAPLARMSSDIFMALVPAGDAQSRIEEAVQEVNGLLEGENTYLHAGIRYFSPQERVPVSMACEQAKAACDSIKKERSRAYCIFSEHLRQELEIRSYVISHIDEAVENGYIEIYYQPVVRTLTGKLAGMEALARWRDPVYGFLRPDQFIPVLEEERLIDKLDRYVIRECGRQLRRQIDAHRPIVPISFNVSRMDFQLMDVLSEIEAVVRENELPRDYLRIEITETAMVQDSDKILKMIDRFRSNGYSVWLDDFGSGYSSLNVLKDYHFDELKIDMEFLRDFNDTSRKIITSVVMMAKAIGIHTLAEGVETREQVRFLRSIGCEKIQGYYYGKPVPCEDFQQYCLDNDLHLESCDDTELLNKAGLVDMNQTAPVAILYDDNEQMTMLQANALYLDALHSIGTPSVERVNINFRSKNFPMNEKFRRFLERGKATGQWESMMYVDNGQYMRVKIKKLAARGTHSVHQLHLSNISADKAFDDTHSHRFDTIVRNVLLTYDAIWYVNLDQDVIEIIEALAGTRVGMQFHDTAATMQRFASRYVHPADRERFLAFATPAALYERASTSPKSFITAPFRILMSDGHYVWIF